MLHKIHYVFLTECTLFCGVMPCNVVQKFFGLFFALKTEAAAYSKHWCLPTNLHSVIHVIEIVEAESHPKNVVLKSLLTMQLKS
jgi:hypothetical protein